ncbi:MAG: hypothetical protein JSY10_27180 [Paenibacillus sp.]|nr:hypothetical protein [Paenibacillus sp.]
MEISIRIIANDSITNKQATGKSSIYHTCRSVLNALSCVEGFEIYFNSQQQDNSLTLPHANDPLTELWHICLQGSSLCYLYNTLKPEQPIMTANKNNSAANKSKACVYHFIIACRDQLHFAEDTLFTVTELFQNDTNGFVKVMYIYIYLLFAFCSYFIFYFMQVVNTVRRILDMLEENGTISVQSMKESALTTDSPKDMRDNVVFELLSTERKYVQDLEGLQVKYIYI